MLSAILDALYKNEHEDDEHVPTIINKGVYIN